MKIEPIYTIVLVFLMLFGYIALADKPDLTGVIYGVNDQPLAGATVYVYTAGVKEGTSPYCPSCYADCGKKATTDDQGRFTIPALDPELLFKILVVAENFSPVFVEYVDPAEGPMNAALSPVPAERLAPEHTIKGRVLDPKGKPVVGATIDVFGRTTERGSTYGPARGVDPLTITNQQGEFILTSEDPGVTVFATIRARGLAPQNENNLNAGADVHEIHLRYGVTVTGKLLLEGKPIDGAVIGVVQTNRRTGVFLGEYTIGVNEDGEFILPNIAPNFEYSIYAKAATLQDKGATPPRIFSAGNDISIVELGALEIKKGSRLSGQVTLSDGQPIPKKTRLTIGRDDAWDSIFCTLDGEGRFVVKNLLPGEYSIHVRVKGYRMSEKNYSLDPLNRRGLKGLITKDIDNLKILLEPGKVDRSSGRDPAAVERWSKLKTETIRGI